MRITCLMENTVGNGLCQVEHGLSIYIEMENRTVLVDTGASSLFTKNANKLGVDLTKVETLFLSHGHYDHGGGILDFHKINLEANIVIQEKAFGEFWHSSENVEKYIGLEPTIKEISNLVLLDGDCAYCENGEILIFTLNHVQQENLVCWPKGNRSLKEYRNGEYIQDKFEHEQYIVLKEKEKTVLVSGCAHNGILNILNEYKNKYGDYPNALISGFHMRKKNGYEKEDFEMVEDTAKKLKETGILCYTGHCTGEEPFEAMKKIMGEQLQYLHCGDVIEI